MLSWLINLFRLNPAITQPKKPKANKTLSSPGFGFVVEVDGEDLVVRNTRATCFGGTNDPQDSGDTASGISTKNPSRVGCALPMHYTGSHRPTRDALFGSPLPKIPWGTIIEVTCGQKTITVPVIDLGPHKKTGNGIDLTVASAKQFNPNATATRFAATVTYRIRGGKQFLNN